MTATSFASAPFYFVYQIRSQGQRVVHAHSGIEIHFLEEGDGYYSAGTRREEMVPGRLTLMFGPHLHRVISNPHKSYCRTVLHIPETVIDRALTFLELESPWLLPNEGDPVVQVVPSMRSYMDMRRVFRHIQREVRNQGSRPSLTPIVAVYLAELLHILNTQSEGAPHAADTAEAASPYDQYLVERACEIVQSHDPDLCASTLASKMGVSPGHLWRVFVSVLGVNPRQYLLEHRMTLAKNWLKEGEPVSLVAEKCCYADVSSFSRAFKSYAGVSPRAYVRMHE